MTTMNQSGKRPPSKSVRNPICFLLCAILFIAVATHPVQASTFNAASSATIPSLKIYSKSRNLGSSTGQLNQFTRILDLRGGQSADPNNYPDYDDGVDYYETPVGYESPSGGTLGGNLLPEETVQERVEAWRASQLEQSQSMTKQQLLNPRDERGRLKLMSSMGTGARAIIFFVMMWRDVHLYENADQAFTGVFRLIVVVPLLCMFVSNLVGFITSLSASRQAGKKRLKAILNLNKLMEAFMLLWYFLRLTIAPSKYIPREIYIGSALHSIFFLLQCQGATRLNWSEAAYQNEVAALSAQKMQNQAGNDSGGNVPPEPQYQEPPSWYGQDPNQQYQQQQQHQSYNAP